MTHFWHWIITQDQNLFLILNRSLNQIPVLEYILGWPTFLGQPRYFLPLTALFLFLWDRRGWWRVFLVVMVGYVISGGASELLKVLTHRERPFEIFSNIYTHFKVPSTKAFPSGHVVVVTCVLFVLNQIYSNKFAWAYLLIVWVALTRIYVGVHYPLDVIGGFLLGWVGGWISLQLFHKLMMGPEHHKLQQQ